MVEAGTPTLDVMEPETVIAGDVDTPATELARDLQVTFGDFEGANGVINAALQDATHDVRLFLRKLIKHGNADHNIKSFLMRCRKSIYKIICALVKKEAPARSLTKGMLPDSPEADENVKELGRGGCAAVFKSERLPGVVFKVLHPIEDNVKTAPDRFAVEATISAEVTAAGIHGISALIANGNVKRGKVGSKPFLVFELIQGSDLHAVLKKKGFLPMDEVATILLEYDAILQDVHRRQIVHRDVKPSNMMERDAKDPKAQMEKYVLMDFGLAGRLNADPNEDRLTRAGQGVGTQNYAPRDQIFNARETDSEFDYSALAHSGMELACGKNIRSLLVQKARMKAAEAGKNFSLTDYLLQETTHKLMQEFAAQLRKQKLSDERISAMTQTFAAMLDFEMSEGRAMLEALESYPEQGVPEIFVRKDDAVTQDQIRPDESTVAPQPQPASRKFPTKTVAGIGATSLALIAAVLLWTLSGKKEIDRENLDVVKIVREMNEKHPFSPLSFVENAKNANVLDMQLACKDEQGTVITHRIPTSLAFFRGNTLVGGVGLSDGDDRISKFEQRKHGVKKFDLTPTVSDYIIGVDDHGKVVAEIQIGGGEKYVVDGSSVISSRVTYPKDSRFVDQFKDADKIHPDYLPEHPAFKALREQLQLQGIRVEVVDDALANDIAYKNRTPEWWLNNDFMKRAKKIKGITDQNKQTRGSIPVMSEQGVRISAVQARQYMDRQKKA